MKKELSNFFPKTTFTSSCANLTIRYWSENWSKESFVVSILLFNIHLKVRYLLQWILSISSRKDCKQWKSYRSTHVEELFTFPFDHNSSKEEQACMPKQTIERFPRWRLVLWGEWCWRWCMGNRWWINSSGWPS